MKSVHLNQEILKDEQEATVEEDQGADERQKEPMENEEHEEVSYKENK